MQMDILCARYHMKNMLIRDSPSIPPPHNPHPRPCLLAGLHGVRWGGVDFLQVYPYIGHKILDIYAYDDSDIYIYINITIYIHIYITYTTLCIWILGIVHVVGCITLSIHKQICILSPPNARHSNAPPPISACRGPLRGFGPSPCIPEGQSGLPLESPR